MTAVRVSREIRHVEINGRVVVLDFRTQSYSVLDPVASSMWGLAATGCPVEEAIAALEARYEADPARLHRDYAAFLGSCTQRGLLVDAADSLESSGGSDPRVPPARGGSSPKWLTIRAWLSLFRVSRLLRQAGFSQAYRQIGRSHPTSTDSGETEKRLDVALHGFRRAESFYCLKRAPDDCLPRSLSLFVFLRSLGIPVEHRIGVQMNPFLAHAWVQFGDRILLDDPANSSRFTRIAGLPE